MERFNFIVLIILFSSCMKWELKDHWGIAAWSEDDKGIAIVRLNYEMETKPFGAQTRNYRFRVNTALISNINNTKTRGKEMDGQVQKIFYMRDKDYVITKTLLKKDSGDEIIYYQFLGDGSVRTLMTFPVKKNAIQCNNESWVDEINENGEVIPSPNGNHIAVVRLNLTCEGVKTNVKFLNPDDGAIISQETILLTQKMFGAWENGNKKYFNTQNKFAWNESGQFMLGFEELKNNVVTNQVVGWLISPGENSSELDKLDYSCFVPSTKSSYYSKDGKFISTSMENNKISIDASLGKVEVFGCN